MKIEIKDLKILYCIASRLQCAYNFWSRNRDRAVHELGEAFANMYATDMRWKIQAKYRAVDAVIEKIIQALDKVPK